MSTDLAAALEPRTAVVLARTGAAEWSRIWSVRSTWWFALATAVAVVGLGVIIGYDVRGEVPTERPDDGAWMGGRITGMPGLFGILALAVVTATADHGTGGIVPTLQWTPRRGVLLVARTTAVVLTITLLGLLLVTAASLVIRVLAPELGLPADEGARTLGRIAFVYGSGTLLSVGLGLLTRSTAGGLVSVLALLIVVPLLLAMFGYDWSERLAEHLPGASAIYLILGEGAPDMTTQRAVVILSAWALAGLVAGAWRLLRADADR